MIIGMLQVAMAFTDPRPEMVLGVKTPAEAIANCQVQRAAKAGMVAEVFTGEDGSFMVSCMRPQPLPIRLDTPPPTRAELEFTACRSRYNFEPKDSEPFCRAIPERKAP